MCIFAIRIESVQGMHVVTANTQPHVCVWSRHLMVHSCSHGWKEALWAKFYIGAPPRQRRTGADVLGGVERFCMPRIEADESFEAEANAYNEAAARAMPDAEMI